MLEGGEIIGNDNNDTLGMVMMTMSMIPTTVDGDDDGDGGDDDVVFDDGGDDDNNGDRSIHR